MAKKLRNIKLDRVDLVAEGANPGATIEIFKHATEEITKATFAEIQDARALGDMLSEVCNYTWDLQDAIFSSLYAGGNSAPEVMTSVQQFSDAVTKALASWTKGEAIGKSKDNEAVARVTDQLTKMKTRLATIVKEAPVSAAAVEPTPTPETIQKQINEALAKQKADHDTQLEAIKKEAEAATAKAAAAEDSARIEKEKRERSELVQKAKDVYKGVPGTPEELADLLFVIDKAVEAKVFTDEQRTALLAKLKAGSEAQLTLTSMEKGADGDTTIVDGPVAKLNEKAAEIHKAHPALTKEQAFAKAWEENPELARQSRQSRRVVEEA